MLVKVSRTSIHSGITREIEIDVTIEQLDTFNSGVHVQRAFPHLDANVREFLLTGMTQEEWDELHGPEEKYDEDDDDKYDKYRGEVEQF